MLVQAADFLNDSDCLNQLAARLGGFLFPTCSTDTTHAEGVLVSLLHTVLTLQNRLMHLDFHMALGIGSYHCWGVAPAKC